MAAFGAVVRTAATSACDGVMQGPVAQAVFGAITVACALGAARKDAATWVAAAARGAAHGAAAATCQPVQPLVEMQGLLHMLGAPNAKAAVAELRHRDCAALASRVQRLSNIRNGAAHPDVSLTRDVAAAVASWIYDEEDSGHKDSVTASHVDASSTET
jgi:hypothetical protein